MARKPTRDGQSNSNGKGKGDKGKKKKGRGPGKNIDPPKSENDRPLVTIEGVRFRRQPYKKDGDIARLIAQTVRNLYQGDGTTSYKHEWDGTLKKACFHEFTRRYRIDTNVRTEDAEKLYDRLANRAFSRSLYEARLEAIEATESEDPRDWINFEPHWILRPAWKLLIQEWCGRYFRSISDRNRGNRLASGDLAFATTGSQSILDHKYQMKEDNDGREPDMGELFVRTHTKKKTGQLVSEKAKKAKENVDEAMKKKYGDDPANYPSWDVELWCDATGGKPHGHYYGMGGAIDPRVPRASNSSQVPTNNHPPPGYVDMETVQKLIAKVNEDALEREEAALQRTREMLARQERRYQRMLKEARRDSRRMYFEASNGRPNDGASTSRSPSHHQADWYDSRYDGSDDGDSRYDGSDDGDSEDEILYGEEEE